MFKRKYEQANLFADDERIIKPNSKDLTIQEHFEEFHALNPWVYYRLVAMARSWKARGHKKIGIATLVETLRWQYGMATTGDDFYLNNNFRSRYSRKIMAENPDLEGIFDTRELTA